MTWVGSHNPHEKLGVVVCNCNSLWLLWRDGRVEIESHKPVSLDYTAWRSWDKTLVYWGADGRGVWQGGGESSTPPATLTHVMSLLGRSQFSLRFVAAVGGDIEFFVFVFNLIFWGLYTWALYLHHLYPSSKFSPPPPKFMMPLVIYCAHTHAHMRAHMYTHVHTHSTHVHAQTHTHTLLSSFCTCFYHLGSNICFLTRVYIIFLPSVQLTQKPTSSFHGLQ